MIPGPVSRRNALALAIVLVAAALRFAGLGFGLPMAEARPDEMTIAFQAMKFGTGDLNPHSFNYPTLHKYVMFGLFGLHYVAGRLTGEFAGKDDFLRAFFDGAVDFRLWMRVWSATMGTVGVALLLRAPGGLASAALFAVSMLSVRDSHFGVTDTTMVTLTIATLVVADRAVRTGRTRDLLVAAVLGGLATSTKYTAGLLAVPLAIASFTGAGTSLRAGAAWRMRRLFGAGGVMILAFVLGSPYVILDFPTFWRDFQYEAGHLDQGQYVDVGGGWVQHLRTLVLTQGVGFVALSFFAVVYWVVGAGKRDDRARGLLWLSFPFVYYLAIGRGETAFFRYALPLIPFLAVALGWLLLELGPLGLVIGAACGLPGLIGALQVDRLFLAGDTRDAMGQWIEANVLSDSVIVHAGAYTGAPMLQRNVANQTREYDAKAGRADSAGFRKPDELKWYNARRPMYDLLFIRKPGIDFASQVDVLDLVPSGVVHPRLAQTVWLELEAYPLIFYASVPEELRAFATTCALAHSEHATPNRAAADPDDLDQQDALYLPAAGFGAYQRMGPNLDLYRCDLQVARALPEIVP